MAQKGNRPALPSGTYVAMQFALGVGLLVTVAVVAEWIDSEQASLVFLGVSGAALVISAIVQLGRKTGAWTWIIETAERTMSTDRSGAVDDTGLYRFALLAIGFFVAAVPVGVLAIMAIWDLGFGDVWPYLLAAAAVLLLVLALMAISYAPPGPNWIHRIAGIDGRALLVMVGIAVVVLGTLQFFEYGSDGSPPSDWWLTVVAAGLLIGLIGLSRRRHDDGRHGSAAGLAATVEQIHAAARRTRRHAGQADQARRRAELATTDNDDTNYSEAVRAAQAAEISANQADEVADRAAGKWRAAETATTDAAKAADELTKMLAETRRRADAAASSAKAARNAADQLERAADATEDEG
ncbi:MAG: hypothetical protein AAF531_06035 [Actinomycetota bacterium]